VVDMRNKYKVLVGKHEWKKLFGRSRRRLDDNIKNDLSNIV
jgi:hypothetical protein